MTEPMPPGIHLRPEGYHGSRTVLMLWDYHSAHRYDDAIFPLPEDPFYPEIVIRGMTKLAPGLQRYVDRLPRCQVDGGYYTKTVENRPLVGPLPVDGAYISAAFSGYGLMAAPAAGELLAAHVTGSTLPRYAGAFLPRRYESAEYRARVANWGSSGQL
jgi:glycine/D-amino acid oxidase-like deaminating enzyme